MKAKSIHANTPGEIQSALNESTTNGFAPTLAIVFISVKQDRDAVRDILKKESIEMIGATSSGEFTDRHDSDGAIAMLLLDMKTEFFTTLFCETKAKDFISATKQTIDSALSQFDNPAFILCTTFLSETGERFDGQTLIHTIQDIAGKHIPIFGAMAGADGEFQGTCVFDSEKETYEGFVLLVLDNDKIDLYGEAVSGWKPLGKIRTVTKASGDWIYALDDQPALEMYLRYLGQKLDSDDLFYEIGIFHPFLSIDAGEPFLRTPIEVDVEKNAIKLDFAVPEGKKLQFTMPPDFDIIETVLETAANLKSDKNAEADALLIFSCFGRRGALGPMVKDENEGLYEIWQAPMAGFFSYGEYGNDKNNEHVFHSTTNSWVALKEKS